MIINNKITATGYRFAIFLLTCFVFYPAFAKEAPTVIPEVNLKAADSPVKKAAAHVQMTHFSREKIAQSPVVNVAELFRQEQSIVRLTETSGGGSLPALSLRGFGDNAAANSLILVDGFPLTNTSLLTPNFNSIPLTDIERIDITQGSQGTLWGDQAVGGVVNIVTRHPKKWFADALASAGSYNTYYANGLSGDKFSNGFFYKVFGIADQTQHYRAHNSGHGDNGAIQAGYDYARGMLSLNLQAYETSIEFPGGLSEAQFMSNPRQATNFSSDSRSRTELIQLLSRHALTADWLLETRIDQHATKTNGFIFYGFHSRDAQTSLSPRLSGTLYHSKVITGYDGQVSNYQLVNKKIQSRTTAKQNSVYAEVVIPLSTQFDFTLGGRAAWQANSIEKIMGQRVDTLNRVWVSEQGLTFHPSSAWSFFLRRDGNYSFPKANEETWVPANVTSLKTQTGVSYETGASWQTAKNISQINLYRLALHDEIAFNPMETPTEPFGSFTNFARTLRHGVTLTESYQLTPALRIGGQWNYVNARFASGPNAGHLIPAVPAITGNLGLHYAFNSHWQTQYDLLYNGSRFASDNVANVGNKLPGYWLSDAAIQYLMQPVIVSLELVNVFNQRYSAYTYFNAMTKSNTYYAGAGRNVLLTIKVNMD